MRSLCCVKGFVDNWKLFLIDSFALSIKVLGPLESTVLDDVRGIVSTCYSLFISLDYTFDIWILYLSDVRFICIFCFRLYILNLSWSNWFSFSFNYLLSEWWCLTKLLGVNIMEGAPKALKFCWFSTKLFILCPKKLYNVTKISENFK